MGRRGRFIAAVFAAVALATGVPAVAAPYTNGLPASPDYFPIGVWLQQPRHALEFQELGINLFVGLWKGPTEDQLATLAANHMDVAAAQNDVALSSPNANVVKMWALEDEPDNAKRIEGGGFGPCVLAADVAAEAAQQKAKDPTRPVFVNFGAGVAWSGWIGRGSKCFGDMAYYDDAIKGSDILCFDIYPVANSDARIQGKLEYVGRGVDNLVKRAAPGQTVWAIIETTMLQAKQMVTPDQLRSEVWMAIIHGAKGIVYFVHEWTGGFKEDGVFRHPEIVDAMMKLDASIKTLAPVINSESIPGKASVSSPAITTMVKESGGALYLFAVSNIADGQTVSFSVSGIKKGGAVVVDENRSVAISNGTLSDSFAPYAVHIYEIPEAGR